MSENKTTIKEIKKIVESWLESNRIKILNNNIDIEINRNEEDLYFIELNKDNDYLVDLKVHLPEFAPYRYISFEIIGMQNNEIPGVIYAWYDDENSALEEIINNLDSSLDYLINLGKNTDNSKFKIWKVKKEESFESIRDWLINTIRTNDNKRRIIGENKTFWGIGEIKNL